MTETRTKPNFISEITKSNWNMYNMVSVWSLGFSSPVPVERGGIIELSERSGYLNYQKKRKKPNQTGIKLRTKRVTKYIKYKEICI